MLEGKASDGRKLLRDVGGDLELTIYDDGVAIDADVDPTVTVTRADGTAVATGAATTKPPATTGIYRFTLTVANAPEVDLLKAVWSATISGTVRQFVTKHEIMGAFYVTEKDVRDFDANLADATDDEVNRAIDWFEDTLERYAHFSLIPRYHREVVNGNGTDTLYLEKLYPRAILSAEVDGTAVADLTDWHPYRTGRLVRDDGETFVTGFRNVEIAYEYGRDDEPDGEVHSAALVAIRAKLLRDQSGIPANTRTLESSAGSFNLELTGPDRPTGIPEMDSLIASIAVPLVA